MASIKRLKKEMSYAYGELVSATILWEMSHNDKPTEQTDKLLDSIYTDYDNLLTQVNAKTTPKKQHFRAIRKQFEASLTQLVNQVNAL